MTAGRSGVGRSHHRPGRQRAHRSRRPPDPRAHRPPVDRERGSQHRPMGVDTPLVRLVLGHDDPAAHACRIPAALPRHRDCEACLAIDAADEGVDVDDVGLELDDGERPSRACHARMSMTPRSPQIENEASGTTCHPGEPAKKLMTDSCNAEWAAFRRRSSSPPRHRATTSTRTSRAWAIARIAPEASGRCARARPSTRAFARRPHGRPRPPEATSVGSARA